MAHLPAASRQGNRTATSNRLGARVCPVGGWAYSPEGASARNNLPFDLDFCEIAALPQDPAVAVILFRLSNTRGSHGISRLEAVLTNSPSALARLAVVLVEESRHRIRYLPVGEP